MSPLVCGQLIFSGVPRQSSEGESSLFNRECGFPWISTHKSTELDTHLTLCTEMNSKWMIILTLRAKSTEHLEKNPGAHFSDPGVGTSFWDMTPQTRDTKEKDKLDSENWTVLCFKGDHQEGEKTTHRTRENSYKSHAWGGVCSQHIKTPYTQ